MSMQKKFYLNLVVAIILLTIGASSFAGPLISIYRGSSLYIGGDLIPDPGAKFESTSSSSLADTYSVLGNHLEGYANLSTGKLGLMITDTTPAKSFVSVSASDSLTFSTSDSLPTTVSYDFNVNGIMSNSSDSAPILFDHPVIHTGATIKAYVTVFDTTDSSHSLVNQYSQGVAVGSPELIREYESIGYYGMPDYPEFWHDGALIMSTDGTLYPIAFPVSGSFVVYPGHTYDIRLSLQGLAEGVSGTVSLDFMHTGTFRFTELNGATFESSSGTFLSSLSPVPEPKIYIMLLGGLGLLSLMKLRDNSFV